MDWKKYEKEIFDTFQKFYPSSKISFNQKIIGRYSQVERQVDVLVEGRIAGKTIKLVVDGKYYSEKVDVKEVESFISMVEDINAAQGILITSQGYTQGAINRAYYGPTDIELDILNFEELQQFQGPIAIPYSGKHGVLITAPFGWVIDGTKRQEFIATIYQRGKTLESACKSKELIYLNFYHYDELNKNLNEVIKTQEQETLSYCSNATFDYKDSIERRDKKRTVIRKLIREGIEIEEYTGFVDFEDFCVFCVLLTPEQLKNKNIRKLEYLIENLHPVHINQDVFFKQEFTELQTSLKKTRDKRKKADIYIEIAKIQRTLNDIDNAKETYQKSIQLFPHNYGAHLGLLEIGYCTDYKNVLIEKFYNLFPGNRQICDDLVRLGFEHGDYEYIAQFLQEKVGELKNDSDYEGIGTIYFSIADIYYTSNNFPRAMEFIKLAREIFLRVDKSHIALNAINDMMSSMECN